MSENFTRIEPLGADTPGARYTSSLALCEEALIDGRWIGRYFSPIARFDDPGEAAIVTGRELAERGVRVRLPNPMTSQLILVEEGR